MSAIKQSKERACASWAEVAHAWVNFFKDISLFASLQLARFMVWRTLRQRRRQARAVAPPAHNVAADSCSGRQRQQEKPPPAQGMETDTTVPVWCGYLK